MVFGIFGGEEKPVDLASLGILDEAPMVAPAGVYQVRVRVVEARDLSAISSFSLYQSLLSLSFKTQVESTDRLPNVVTRVLLTRDGFKPQKRKTMVEKETSSPLWNQLFYFDEVEVAEGELDACSLTISVADKSRIGKDMVIGTCDLSLSSVYLEEGHELWNEWLTLTDQRGRRQGSQGQICVCVTVLRGTDMPVVRGDNADSDDDSKPIGAAPSEDNVEPETWLLKAQLYSGRDLPRMDRFGQAGVDAYFKLQCGSAKPVKSAQKRSQSPDWNQELILRLVVPPGRGGLATLPPVKMSLMDADFDSDDHIASQQIEIRDLLLKPEEYLHPKWYSFYGGPRGMELAFFTKMSKLAKRMNAGYIDGSAYRGRVLVGMQVLKETKALKGLRAKKKIPSVLEKLGKEWPCFLHTEVYGVELNQSRHVGKSVSVELTMGLTKCASPNRTLRSEGSVLGKECYADLNVCMTPMRVKLPTPFEGPLAGDGTPDLFIDVYVASSTGGRRRVGYCRVPCKNLMPVNETHTPVKQPQRTEAWKLSGWFQLQADALGNHKRGESRRAEHARPVGQVLLRMMIQGSPVAKRGAKMLTPEELAKGAGDDDVDANGIDDDEEGEGGEGGEGGGGAKDKAKALERRSEQRGDRIATSTLPEPIPPLATQRYMLQCQLYQAKELPSADAQGASDPFAVVRCGRNQAQTHVCKATTSPAWFREMFLEVDLPLNPSAQVRKARARGAQAQDQDGDDEGEGSGGDSGSEGSGGGSGGDVEAGSRGRSGGTGGGGGGGELGGGGGGGAGGKSMTLGEASSRGIRPGGGGSIGGFEGIAWWAAPSMSVIIFDQDEGVVSNDVDALSILSLPLIHPSARRPAPGGGNTPGEQAAAPPSTLASSASMWSALSIDDMLPDQFDDLSKYRVGLVEPEWHQLRQLNPSRGGGIGFRSGGHILLHYTLKAIPPEGLYRYAGEEPPKLMLPGYYPKVVRSLGDFFGSNPVEVQVLLLGLRGMEPYRRIPITNPCVEIELTGALPLFPGCPFTIAKSNYSSNPSGANANFNGQVLRLRGRVHRLDKVELALSIRVIDSLPFKRMVGTGEYRLNLRGEEEEEKEEEKDAKGKGRKGGKKKKVKTLKAIKAKTLTPEELREMQTREMDSTASENSFSDSSTTTALGQSDDDTESQEDDPRGGRADGISLAEHESSHPVLSIANSLVSSTSKGLMKRMSGITLSMTKEGRRDLARQKKKDEGRFSLSFDASDDRPALSKARSNASASHRFKKTLKRSSGSVGGGGGSSVGGSKKRANLKTVDEGREDDDDGGGGPVMFGGSAASVDDCTVLSGADTAEFTTDDDSDSDNSDVDEQGAKNPDGDGADGDIDREEGQDAAAAAAEEEEEDDSPTFDDGSGRLPDWMDGRMMVTDGTLEDHIQPVPFITIPIMRAKGFADNTSERVEGGRLKCVVRVLPLEEQEMEEELLEEETVASKIVGVFSSKARKKKEMKAIMRRDEAFVADESAATLPREHFLSLQRLIGGGPAALLPQNIIVRAFVVRGKNFRPLDPSGLCDPYLKVELQGTNKRFGRRTDKIKETLSPWFYKMFQFTTELPGCSQLQFKLFDWDRIGGDGFIGSNTVDLEDRWFSAMWQGDFAKMPPLEVRSLLNPDAVGNQGLLELWVEMYESGDTVPKPMKITPPPVVDIEMRVVVFKARNMVNKDIGGQNDLFFKCNLVGIDHKQTRFGQLQETDTHYFATDGRGSFNYRLIYRFTLPVMRAKLRIAAYDRDLIGSNDNIGEAVIPLTGLCHDLMRTIQISPEGELAPGALAEIKANPNISQGFNFDSLLDGPVEGLWVPLYHPSKNDILQGEVEVMIQLLPVKKAEQRPVGKAREQPNRDPELRAPVRQTLNPFDPLGSLAILLGPDLLRKVLIVGICMLCLFLSCSLAVFVINDVLSAYINIAIQKASSQMPGSGLPPNAMG